LCLGVAVLDYAKFIIYNMHYNGIKRHFGDRAILSYTDTGNSVHKLKFT